MYSVLDTALSALYIPTNLIFTTTLEGKYKDYFHLTKAPKGEVAVQRHVTGWRQSPNPGSVTACAPQCCPPKAPRNTFLLSMADVPSSKGNLWLFSFFPTSQVKAWVKSQRESVVTLSKPIPQ